MATMMGERIRADDTSIARFLAYGPVRGDCGHIHTTYEGAAGCVARDQRACLRIGGGTTAYSDRRVAEVEPGVTVTEYLSLRIGQGR
jgi:hypothetical protein